MAAKKTPHIPGNGAQAARRAGCRRYVELAAKYFGLLREQLKVTGDAKGSIQTMGELPTYP